MIRNFFRCIYTVFKFATVPAIILIILSIFTGLTLPASLMLTQKLIDSLMMFAENKAELNTILWYGGILSLVILFMNHISYISRIFLLSLEKTLACNLSKAILDKVTKIQFSAFEDSHFNDALSKMHKNPSQKIIKLFNSVRALIVDCIKLFGLVFIFFQVSFWLALGFFVFLILEFLNETFAVKQIHSLYASQTSDERALDDYINLLSNKDSLIELKIFSAVPFILKKFKTKYDSLLKERIGITLRGYKFQFFAMFSIIGWSAFLLYIIVFEILKGRLQVGLFTALIASLTEIINLVIFMSGTFYSLTDENLNINFLYEFMNIPEDIHYRKENYNSTPKQKIHSVAIRFENVSFTYPGTEKQILSNVSFTIEPNQHIALVGKNGSGKTTLIKLIAGLYQPTSGNIFIDNKNINTLSQAEIHSAVSVVFQDYAKYQLSLRENIALGEIAYLTDDEYLKQAISFISDDEVFSNLDLQLGKLEKTGVDLSGGQWQKLAIARACLAKSSFIIFDEPTASLDPSAERDMYFNLEKIIKNRGCIFISHRLASARLADKIFVLDAGSIVEQGTHFSLMNDAGLYANMYESQSFWYK